MEFISSHLIFFSISYVIFFLKRIFVIWGFDYLSLSLSFVEQLVSPGAWLSDMCQERYEVREKTSSKKVLIISSLVLCLVYFS